MDKMIAYAFFLSFFIFNNNFCSVNPDTISPFHKVTLSEAHIGNLEVDIKLLDSYGNLPENIRQFYLDARTTFSGNPDADFSDAEIINAARKHNLPLMGGPMLGNLREDGVVIFLRPSTSVPLLVKVIKSNGSDEKSYEVNSVKAGVEQRIVLDGLISDTDYRYAVYALNQKIAEGGFTIPRPSGFKFYEFEAASLGGVPGPDAMANNNYSQMFGYLGADIIAFGEFTFDTSGDNPYVIFRLIDESGQILEEHTIPYSKLTP